MALHWELRSIDNWETVCCNEDGTLSGTTECLIWATMMVGLSRITASNAKKFYERLHAWETARGAFRSDRQPLDFNDVVRHIGLATNASHETDAQFRKKLMRALEEEARRKAERATTPEAR